MRCFWLCSSVIKVLNYPRACLNAWALTLSVPKIETFPWRLGPHFFSSHIMHCFLEGLENTLNSQTFLCHDIRASRRHVHNLLTFLPPETVDHVGTDGCLSSSHCMAPKMIKQYRVWDCFPSLSDSESKKNQLCSSLESCIW